MARTTEEYLRQCDIAGIHWTDPTPPPFWGDWTDEAIEDMAEADGMALDRLDARDEAEAK